MKIPRWDWNLQAFVEDEYPDTMFTPFLTWILTTKAWVEYPDLVNSKVLVLQRQMAEYRTPVATHREAPEPSELEEKAAAINKAEELKQLRRDNLAKARAAKKAKREMQDA